MAFWRRNKTQQDEARNERVSCWISYSRADSGFVAALVEELERLRVTTLSDTTDVQAGENWAVGISRLMARADVVLVVLSAESARSEWVDQEVRFALDRGIPVLPVLLGRNIGSRQLPTYLRGLQALTQDEPGRPSKLFAIRVGDRIHQLAEEAGSTPPSSSPRPPDTVPPTPSPSTPSAATPPVLDESMPPEPPPRPERLLDEGKLILVGRGEVGKTSLVRRLVDDEFRPDEPTTQGIRIVQWAVPVDDRSARLNVWDFGGQEIMHATHRFFLTEQSLYVLVLNGRGGDEDTDAEYWLRHIQSFGGESPVIVVLNKIGQHPFHLNYRGLRDRYPQIRAFVRTDCADGLGISELRDEILAAAAEMPEVSMRIPSDWFAVKEHLETMDLDFIDHGTFREICDGEGVADELDRETLSFVLHCLGIALNYRKDPRLRETSVLRPEWVTGGIYRILTAERLADRGGELRLTDLDDLLPADRYPTDKRQFLVELMRKFDLCFPFRDEHDTYLVPDLLGKEQPEEATTFDPDQCLNFEYRYDIVPEGLLPRFIVRSRSLSGEHDRWRSGVILRRGECRALVSAHPSDGRVRVRINGSDTETRRHLLAIIRYDLDAINDEFKEALGATAVVPIPGHPSHAIDHPKLLAFERDGIPTIHELVDDEVVEIEVAALLNGVDVAGLAPSPTMQTPPSVFFSYAHEDETLRDELETHLKLLQRQGLVSAWHDRKLLPGSLVDDEIDRALTAASIVLLLVSADFLASDYCWGTEMRTAIERHRAGEAQVVPVMLRSCDWDGAPFAGLDGLPTDMRPVTGFPDRDEAWTEVAKGIRALVTSAGT